MSSILRGDQVAQKAAEAVTKIGSGPGFFDSTKTNKHNRALQRRLTASASHKSLPMPSIMRLNLDFDPQGGMIALDGRPLLVHRIAEDPQHGYQREYEDDRSRAYGRAFNWALFGTPIINLRDDGTYYCITGQHRIPAAGYAGHTSIPVAVYEGLSLEDEAWIFNQEATQKRDQSALGKFHSGVQAGLPDYVAVARIVENLGGTISAKSTPRIGNVRGITAAQALLETYDYVGGKLLDESLSIIKQAYGALDGGPVDGVMIKAMAMFLGIHSEGSQFGYADRDKFLRRLSAKPIEWVKSESAKLSGMGQLPARYNVLVKLYNAGLREQNKLDSTRPDWRKAVPKVCFVPFCDKGGEDRKKMPKPGKVYRRGLCYQHYIEAKQGRLTLP
jgi:hypothetical protein